MVDVDLTGTALSRMPREDAVILVMTTFGWTETRAEFYVSLGLGEILGDIMELDPNDNLISKKED